MFEVLVSQFIKYVILYFCVDEDPDSALDLILKRCSLAAR